MRRIAIIADDLTGALDTASPFACKGLRTICLTTPEAIAAHVLKDAQIVAVSSNSRHLDGAAAAEIVQIAAAKLKAWKPDLILKKIDSRLKGNIAEETMAVARVFDSKRLLIAPAAPDIARHVVKGAVGGLGIERPIRIAERFAETPLAFTVPDVQTLEDMRKVACDLLQDREVLAVCSRGLALALAEILDTHHHQRAVQLAQPILVGIGSRDPITAAQVELLCSSGRFVCRQADQGHVPGDLPRASRMLLKCSSEMSENAAVVARRFADGLHDLIVRMRPQTLLLSGGDTASAVLGRLGKSLLAVKGEVAAGLPVSLLQLGSFNVSFISKSGGFGGPTTLLDLLSASASDSQGY
jgi:uncharacterized protein YgbK (DUF1537 family)